MCADFNGDGLIDIYVANDERPNLLWINQGDGTFKNQALLAGCALDAHGLPQSSMGVDAGDVDNDGYEDLLVTNLSGEYADLYRNGGQGWFDDRSMESGLAALVEVHDETELDRALAIGAQLIGVNNRDLKTFKVDLATTERLAQKLLANDTATPQRKILVAESGIHTRAEVERLARCGAKAILVGESLMKNGNIQAKVKALLGVP